MTSSLGAPAGTVVEAAADGRLPRRLGGWSTAAVTAARPNRDATLARTIPPSFRPADFGWEVSSNPNGNEKHLFR